MATTTKKKATKKKAAKLPRAARGGGGGKALETSVLVAALESAWSEIRTEHPDVPRAIIVLASGTSSRSKKLGHFAPDRWADKPVAAATTKKGRAATMVHEVLISGEGLRGGALSVLDTLLHEGAHGVATVRKIQDTSRSGRYHNKKFQAIAEELGLSVTSHASHGWAFTALTPATKKKWAKLIKALDKAIGKSFRVAEPSNDAKAGSRMLKAACECDEPRVIRVAAKTFKLAAITCGECECDFALEGEG